MSARGLVAGCLAAIFVTSCSAASSASKASESTRPAATTSTTIPGALPSAGCRRATAAAPSGTTRRAVAIGGVSHPYLLEIPAGSRPTRPAPMVLMFHGFGSNGREFASLTRIATRASARGDVAVIPDGPNHTWQLTGRGSDAAFVDTIVNDVETTLCIDRHRVDAAGFSQGAAFAILYGCARPGRIAAIATVAVDLQLGCHAPMPYLAFHGTRDPAVPFDNGAVGASLPGVRMRGTLLNLHDWAQLDRCHPTPTVSALAPQVRRTTWSGCAAGTAVQLYTVIGGSHTWPGADPRKGFGLTTQQLDATVTMLGFFAAHRIG